MKPPSTPLQLAQRAVAGCALLVLAYGLSFLPFPDPQHGRFIEMVYTARWEILITAVPFVAGFLMAIFYPRRLRKGIDLSLWTEQQLEQARTFVEAPALNVAQTILVLAVLIAWIAHTATHHHTGSGLAIIFAINPITSIRQALRKPPAPGPRIDWRNSPRIHSDHWGQPSTP